MIESVDSLKLLSRIDRLASGVNKTQKILLEINISGEASKFGETADSAYLLAETAIKLPNIKLEGFMTMAPFGADSCELRKVFSNLRELRNDIETKFDVELPELSMGMSSDYEIAIEEGATMVRIGTAIFGKRD
jgi:pyridoxal phosphate enzyme (YggS family)